MRPTTALLVLLLAGPLVGGCDNKTEPPAPSAGAPSAGRAFVMASRLKLREQADADSKVVATLPLNAELSVGAPAGSWVAAEVIAPAPLKGKKGFLAAAFVSAEPLTVASATAKAKAAKSDDDAKAWYERAYTLSPSKETLLPLMAVLQKMERHQDAEHFANLLRSRKLGERLSSFGASRIKELTLLYDARNTPGAAWTVPSGTCKPRLEQCQLVQFGRTQLMPVSMTCEQPAPITSDALLEQAPEVAALEKEVGAIADQRGRGLEPMRIMSTTVVDLNGDKRPDRLLVVAFKEAAAGGGKDEPDQTPPYSCLVAEVNGAYQVLDGTLCTTPSHMTPAQAFAMQDVPGVFIRVEQGLIGARGGFLAHYGKGVLAEVRAGCGGNG
jgi:hypothetical protein